MILGGINHDLRRNASLIISCKDRFFTDHAEALLLVVSLFNVVLTNKGTLDEDRLCGYRTVREPVANGEKLG